MLNEQEDMFAKIAESVLSRQFEMLAMEREKDRQTIRMLVNTVQEQNQRLKQRDPDPAAALTNALKGITLTTMNCNIDPPKFDIKKMTPEAFLAAVENHFKSMAYDESKYLVHVKSLLPEDAKSWYNHELPSFRTWKGFKVAFNAKFDSWQDRERRRSELQRKKQHLTQATEKYIYEMIDLSKQCYYDDSVADLVKRAQASLHPNLRVAIGANFYKTAKDLIAACDLATSAIEASDIMYKRAYTVPPMKASDRKGFTKKQENAEQNVPQQAKQTRGRGTFRGNFRGGNNGSGWSNLMDLMD